MATSCSLAYALLPVLDMVARAVAVDTEKLLRRWLFRHDECDGDDTRLRKREKEEELREKGRMQVDGRERMLPMVMAMMELGYGVCMLWCSQERKHDNLEAAR